MTLRIANESKEFHFCIAVLVESSLMLRDPVNTSRLSLNGNKERMLIVFVDDKKPEGTDNPNHLDWLNRS